VKRILLTGMSGPGQTTVIRDPGRARVSAPPDVLAGRLAARTDNPYGKARGEVDRVLADLQAIEPLLRQVAD
jgi:hypothetical protein